MQNNEIFYCYSLRLYHFLSAFDEVCYGSRINKASGNRYWMFAKSERLDKVIDAYNRVKHSIS